MADKKIDIPNDDNSLIENQSTDLNKEKVSDTPAINDDSLKNNVDSNNNELDSKEEKMDQQYMKLQTMHKMTEKVTTT